MVKTRLKGSPKTRIAKTNVAYGFRTTIPKEIRRAYAVKQGMQVVWYDKNGEIRIHFRRPVKSIKELKGSIRGGRELSKASAEELMDREYNL
ncbi:MAG: AbrB/MazE/SpoVT family DNA-binding domain-containing protein [Euryarchaeota archaeon]|nr:AbrB/MazE/SpoVT family DNA-binding domain-containing protein [Euryarchaeota archaeon]MBU4492152.1 AbrB/MazE/SpoVT family DNA-binding domain-containing protein [Euryarchaeota archaeon]